MVAENWISHHHEWAQSHRKRIESRLKKDVYPVLGKQTIASLERAEILSCLRTVEERGAIDCAKRLKQYLSSICRFAIAEELRSTDPTIGLEEVLRKHIKKNHAHTVNPKRLGEILRSIDSYEGGPIVKCALQLLPHVFVRGGELRHADWSEIDLKKALWTIPADRMKRTANGNHLVPLSKQSLQLLKELQACSGTEGLMFPGLRSRQRPISDGTLSAALRAVGIPKEDQSPHGFRHTASTMLNETLHHDPDLIEVQLHHCSSSIRAVYNKAKYIKARYKMMQEWSDYLQGLKA